MITEYEYFRMDSEIHFLISCLQLVLTFSFGKNITFTFLRCEHRKIFKICLAILQYYARKR